MIRSKVGSVLRRSALSSVAVLALAAGAWAQTDPAEHAAHHPAGTDKPAVAADPAAPPAAKPEGGEAKGMMSSGMMQGMGCPMMGGAMAGPTDEKLAQLRDELKITAVQQAKWSDFAEALRAANVSMDSMAKDMHAAGAASLPDRIGRHVIAMESHLIAIKRIQTTALHLYGALSAEQKASADKAFRGMGMM